ncbi:MAG TPA: amino acid aminotransferase [Steroidobacteraceae bacterium]|nr:amino acid aminotransferase [Steroidobacteraceae bacterium]
MFERLERLPDDPILGLMAAYRADPDPRKVDLGVGVYRDDDGETPVLKCVREAERRVLERQRTKTYVGAAGNASFNRAVEQLALGADHSALAAGRVRTIQGVGGCGALRLGAELVHAAAPRSVVHVSTPTWANHVPLLTGCGLALERYPYYDPRTGAVDFSAMLTALDRLSPGSVVLLHASCHNPTGADLAPEQWRELLTLIRRRGLLPFIDMAYQGLGAGVEADAYAARLYAAELPQVLIAVSCSKNFGLYRERAGTLMVVAATAAIAEAALSQEVRIARRLYSMPPDHGAAIVAEVLGDEALAAEWRGEVGAMRERIERLRGELVRALKVSCPRRDFGFIARQRGMFSFLGIDVAQVQALREMHHVYMTEDSRINIAGLRGENLAYFAHAVGEVLGRAATAR